MDKLKKIFNIATKVVSWLLVAFTVFIMIFTVVTVTTVDRNERSIFGFKFYIVQSDSMSPSENNVDLDVHFSAGDIVIIKNLKDATGLEKGEIISFVSVDPDSYGETITHMIYDRKYDDDGEFEGYITYGTNTGDIDNTVVTPEYVLGVYTGKLPGVGNFFAFVKSVPGYFICIFLPFLLLILYNGANVIRLFRKYKKEQTDAMAAERKKIEDERAENQRMMAELLELKAQLMKKESGEAPAENTPSEGSEETSSDTPAEQPSAPAESISEADAAPENENITEANDPGTDNP